MAAARTGFGLTVVALLASAAALAVPPPAAADGDPASDVLLTQWAFVPYGAPISAPVTQQLETVIARTRKAGYPIKVAIIGSPYDLGSVSSLYGKPREYAKFLGSELTFLYHGRLLIVMPQGYGYYDGRGRRGPGYRLTVRSSVMAMAMIMTVNAMNADEPSVIAASTPISAKE